MITEIADIKYSRLPQSWCRAPYPKHPGGCPNYGSEGRSLRGIRKDLRPRIIRECPPTEFLISDIFDLGNPLYMIWNGYPIGERAQQLADNNPKLNTWPMRYNIRYWQDDARRLLYAEIADFLDTYPGSIVDLTPEAHGLYVYAEMRKILGKSLRFGSWPPEHSAENIVYQACLGGLPKDSSVLEDAGLLGRL